MIGPIAPSTKRNGCSLDCTGPIDETSTVVDQLKDRNAGPILHSTRITANEMDNTDYHDREIVIPHARNDRLLRDTKKREIRQHDEFLSPIPGPSKVIVRTPVSAKSARKKPRLEDRAVKRADENDEETTTEEDLDCTCDTRVVDRDAHLRKRLPDRTRAVTRNERKWRREDAEDEEEEEEDDEDEKQEEKEDSDTEDSAYRQLRRRSPRKSRTRERELKRWIRRCREECERRRARRQE